MAADLTVPDVAAARAVDAPAATAIEHGDHTFGFAQLWAFSLRAASALRGHGVGHGDRVAILAPRSVEVLAWLLGTLRIGAVAVPVNDSLKAPQVGHMVRHSGAAVLVGGRRPLAALGPEARAGARPVDNIVPDGEPLDPGHPGPIGRDLALLVYTSGSTGAPKGVMVSHAGLLAGARIVAGYLRLTGTDRILSVLPWSFDAGLNQVLTGLWAGATTVLAESTYAPDICRALAARRITGLAGVPPLWEMLARRPSRFLRTHLPHLRYVTNTGGPLRPDLIRQIRSAHPHTDVFLMYGLTEAFRSTYLDPALVDSRPDSIGRAIPDTEIMVLHADGRRCAPGEIGELVHRGPTVAAGYWRDPEATRRVFRPHPFGAPGATDESVVYSGDYVRTDADGYLYYVGRRDEQFKSRGFRVNPTEIEQGLFATGLVAEAVAYPEPGAVDGGIVAAVVPVRPEAFDLAELDRRCRATLPAFQIPTRWRVVDHLPRTPSGKLDRAGVKASDEHSAAPVTEGRRPA